MVEWYYQYLIHRDIEIEIQGEKLEYSTSMGFPQGGVCSAKFWLIAFDPAIEIINKYGIEGNGFADDCSALIGGEDLGYMLRTMQRMTGELVNWGKLCGLSFNAQKTVVVFFNRTKKQPVNKLVFDGSHIDYSNSVTYLGIKLDARLHWRIHIDDKLTKAKTYLLKIANLTRKEWGPKPKLMRWAFTGIVRPMVAYGALVWAHETKAFTSKFLR